MNYSDFVIIYLACGAPLGFYYFFNNKNIKNRMLRSFFIALIWIPYSIKLLHKKVTKRLINKRYISDKNNIELLQKEFEAFLPKYNPQISLFELREVIERYTELTTAANSSNNEPTNSEIDFFKLNKSIDPQLPAICLNRNNQRKLKIHQNNATRDFVSLMEILVSFKVDTKNLSKLSLKFVKMLNDKETLLTLKVFFSNSLQTTNKPFVNEMENELWKPQEQLQLKEKKISMPFQSLGMTTNPRKKD